MQTRAVLSAAGPNPTGASLYAARHLGVRPEIVLAEVMAALPGAAPNPEFLDAVHRLAPGGGQSR